MRISGTPKQLESRRRRAIRLLKEGNNLPAVAQALDASVSSVFRWRQAYQRQGLRGLKPKPTPGRPPGLGDAQLRRLAKILERGPLAAGYGTDLWTLKRMAEAIRRHFGVRYHPCHVWKILDSLGWSCQKPEKRARERNEAAIRYWKRSVWPHIKKGRRAWSPFGLPR